MNIIFKKILGDPQARTVKRLRKRVKAVNDLAAKYTKLSDAELKNQTEVLKKRLKKEDEHLLQWAVRGLGRFADEKAEKSVSNLNKFGPVGFCVPIFVC